MKDTNFNAYYSNLLASALGKNSSFVKFDLQGWLAAVCKWAVLQAGFLLSLREGGCLSLTRSDYLWCHYPKNNFEVIASCSL
ncbi:MAG: hypothetical protein PF486_03340 [Prolixibacteraceae bacterium]|jgi:hypothetical protein|nr:hypothetical protein [Prolixibacteraceae bacterium]